MGSKASERKGLRLSPHRTIGITALVPPEIIYACGHVPVDLNNIVVRSRESVPQERLCAWAAGWRKLVIERRCRVDAVVVVAGGDCHNSLVEGQKIEMAGIPVYYYSYPFDGSAERLLEENQRLIEWLGGIHDNDNKAMKRIYKIKKKVMRIDTLRAKGIFSAHDAFEVMISCSDLCSDILSYEKKVDALLDKVPPVSSGGNGRKDSPSSENVSGRSEVLRAALLGVPPVYVDFHKRCSEMGVDIVFDEMPYEFARLCGKDLKTLSESYASYSFALPLSTRFARLKPILEERGVEAIIHYTQYACHHTLEDSLIRKFFNKPVLTIQGDLPGQMPEGVALRIESLAQMLIHRRKTHPNHRAKQKQEVIQR